MTVSTSSRPVVGVAPRVHILGLGTAVPSFASTQDETLEFVLSRLDVAESTRNLYRRVFRNESIHTRHFAMQDLAQVLEKNRDRINERFRSAAVALSTESLSRALRAAGVTAEGIDFLAVTTCTGYLCPGLSSYLIESCGLRGDLHAVDIVGMGCGAALPALEQASNYVRAHPGAAAAVVATEICTAAMFSNDEPDVVISNAIFADGSAALVLRSDAPVHGPNGSNGNGRPHPQIKDFASLTVPAWRDTLKFATSDGYLKNVLGRRVPEQAAEAVSSVVKSLLEKNDLSAADISHWVLHAGGEKIIDGVSGALNLPPQKTRSARAVLRKYGNVSSPSVLFVLTEEEAIAPPTPGAWGVMASFGAGFSAHAALLRF